MSIFKNGLCGLVCALVFVPGVAAAAVVGTTEVVDNKGTLIGWVFDPVSPASPVSVSVSVDGPLGTGDLISTAYTSVSRPDVNNAYAIQGIHGFSIPIPSKYLDNKPHKAYVYGQTLDGTMSQTQLPNSPFNFSLIANTPTAGNFDLIDQQGNAVGWAFDPDSSNTSIAVSLYVDGPAGSGTALGWFGTSASRPDVNTAFGITGTHGFSIPIPSKYWDGTSHTAYVYAIDTNQNATNIQIQNSPMKFTLNPASCTVDGTTVQSGASATFYQGRTSTSCATNALVRTCSNGTLSGSDQYAFSSCTTQTPAPSGQFYSGFPHYTDPVTGNTVYQISSQPGSNYTLYYHQYFYNDPDSVIYANLPTGDWKLTFYKVNLRTGGTSIVSQNIANGELIKNNSFFGFNYASTPMYFGRQDISSGVWTNLYSFPTGWTGTGSVTVNSDGTAAIFMLADNAISGHTKTMLLNLSTGTATVLREEPANDGYHYEHYVFSPTDPNVLTFVNQSVPSKGILRIGVGTVAGPKLQPLNIAYSQGGYFDPSVFGGANLAHPEWNSDGRLCSDIVWHQQNPSGKYGYVCFTLGSDPFATVQPASQQLRFIAGDTWNNHYKNVGVPNWFVGDGDLIGQAVTNAKNSFTNVMYMSPQMDTAGSYKTDVYQLAQIMGDPKLTYRNAHIAAGGAGVITTANYSLTGSGTSNVFLIEVPTALKNQMNIPQTNSQVIISAPRVCTPQWSCSNWTTCSASGTQSRSCIDSNNCGTSSGKPSEAQVCTAPVTNTNQSSSGALPNSTTTAGNNSSVTQNNVPSISTSAPTSLTNNQSPTNISNSQCPDLRRTYIRGVSGSDVRQLQTFLIRHGYLRIPAATGYFGLQTERAVQAFQADQNIITYGTPYTTGYGFVGFWTKQAIARVCAND